MVEDYFPAVVMNGEHIVDIHLIRWEEREPGRWSIPKKFKITVTEDADRIVFETAIGCRQVTLQMRGGEDVTFIPSGRGEMNDCDRTRAWQQRQRNEATIGG